MELRLLVRAVRRRWVAFAIVAVAVIAVGAISLLRQTHEYSSTAKSFVGVAVASNLTDLSASNSYVQSVLGSYAQLATTPYVLSSVSEQIGGVRGTGELASEVSVSTSASSLLMSITAADRSPRVAADIANAVTKSLIAAVPKIAPQGGGATTTLKLTEVEPAEPSTVANGPSITSEGMLIVALGLVLGLATAVILDRVSTRIRSEADIRERSELPLLGRIVARGKGRDAEVIAREGAGLESESYDSLRAALRYVRPLTQSRALVTTSAVAGEGKSTIVLNMAHKFAMAGDRVIVVDADLRRPRVADYLGLDSGLGLSDVLAGVAPVEAATQSWGETGKMDVLCAGPVPPNPAQLIQSEQMGRLLDRLSTEYDLVLVDSPPILPVTDAAVLGRLTGGTILVAALGQLRTNELSRALEELSRFGTPVLGLVLNHVPTRGVDAAYSAYAYEVPKSPAARVTIDRGSAGGLGSAP